MINAVSGTRAPTATTGTAIRSLTGAHCTPGYPSIRGAQLRVRRGLRRRVPRLPLQLRRAGLRGARHGGRRQARAPRGERARRRRDGRPGRARRARLDRRGAQRARPLPRSPLGARLPRRGRVARLLAAQARLPRRLARPPRQGGSARGDVGRGPVGLRLRGSPRRTRAARARAGAVVERAAVPPVIRAAEIASFLAAVLAVDTQVGLHGQLLLGGLTWIALAALVAPLDRTRRLQVRGVVCFATIGEVTGSLLWGVYTYRLHNLPLFIPAGHGLVFLAGVSLAGALRERALVWVAGIAAAVWAIAGLTVLPRLDVAGAAGVPLLLLFLWRSRARAIYAAVFLVVAALELYGTAIGTWRWAATLPGLGIPDGNPPSGVAAGYVWFDVMALLVATWLSRPRPEPASVSV